MTIPDAIIAELEVLRQWSSKSMKKISLFDLVGLEANPDLFFAFSELLCPEITLHKGGKFLAARFSLEIFELWQARGTEIKEIERLMNHVHVSWLIQDQTVSDYMAVTIAARLGDVWRRTLSEYDVEIGMLGAEFNDAAVTFYSK